MNANHSADDTFDRAYQYDAIGNRLQGSAGVSPAAITNYTANALNQYTSVGSLDPAHDADGNMTSGPLPAAPGTNSTLTWDAENRLISATVNGITTTYLYDSQSRRICTQSPISNPQSTIHIYDGWNPIAEYSISNNQYSVSRSYTWGVDLSGSLQGVGGVGGLLSVSIHDSQSAIYYPTYDGNGNVSEYVDTTGAIAAHFEYDPFGNTVVNTDASNQFAHRFSTKPFDAATGLYYYGYRWYDPVIGRWPSRDPIGEEGGLNLYGFVGNDGANHLDYLGLNIPRRTVRCKCYKTRDCEDCEEFMLLKVGNEVFGRRVADDPFSECSAKPNAPNPPQCDEGTTDLGVSTVCMDL